MSQVIGSRWWMFEQAGTVMVMAAPRDPEWTAEVFEVMRVSEHEAEVRRLTEERDQARCEEASLWFAEFGWEVKTEDYKALIRRLAGERYKAWDREWD
jgi:hypothetical protein